MNDEPSSSAAAASYSSNDATTVPEPEAEPETAAAPTPMQVAERRKKNRNLFNRKRCDLLDDLVRNLDVLVYAELSAVYYMDCSFLRLLLRSIVQFVLLTPKPALFPEPPKHRPYVGAILGTNILCIMLHVWTSAPSAGEQTREYLHGGLAMDFIGQKGPSSKLHLVLLDLLVLGLQIIHLAAHITIEKLRERGKGVRRSGAAAGTDSNVSSAPTTQTLDAEERGVRRSTEQQDIEMQALNSSGIASANPGRTANTGETESAPNPPEGEEDATSTERDALIASTNTRPRSDAHIFDAFNSGQIVLADLDLWRTVREQFWAYQQAPREEASGTPGSRFLRANLAGRVLGMRFAGRTGLS